MKTRTINVYEFSELSEEAKEKAISKWYENEDYPFLEEDLTESLTSLLEQKGCKFEDICVLYSLSYSQGDGLCFTGSISKDGKELKLTHNYRYYFAKSVEMAFFDKDGEDVDENKELQDIYFAVCNEIEKEGYSILEYRMNNTEFSEHCKMNNYEFDEDGNMI
jgi:hypothetical protein